MRPNYGIDALPVVRNLLLIGIVLLMASILAFESEGFFHNFRWTFLSSGISLVLSSVLMILYAKVGKFRHRERMLKMIEWRGDEQVLDVGTGRGLLMIGTAKRLTSGKAYGIDIFNAADLSGNKIENTLKNAELEDVTSKIEVRNDDAREMSFADDTFDVVVSNLCLHNIPDADGRRKACQEIARVLKPGGTALISDFQKTGEYVKAFTSAGLKTTISGPYLFDIFPPLRIVTATK